MWALTLGTLLICSAYAESPLDSVQDFNLNPSISSFSFGLYKEVIKKETCDIILSPFSAQTILTLLMQGANGQTAIDLQVGLKFAQSSALVAQKYHNLLALLQNNPLLKTVNKIYVQQGYTIRPKFQLVASRDFYSSVQPVNFEQSQATANIINKWVESETNDLIKNLISPSLLDANTRLVLVNAIHFKGAWAKPFNARLTEKATFHSKTNTPVDTMTITDQFNYVEIPSLDAKVVELRYKNSTLSMFVYLPNTNDGLPNLEKKLESFDLTNVLQTMRNQRIALSIPKFTSSFEINLNQALINMGLQRIFSNLANFDGMLESPERLAVTAVVQKAVIEVNEAGAEAAAATAVMMTRLASISRPIQPIIFKADHPFIYTIQERAGPLYFIGRLVNC